MAWYSSSLWQTLQAHCGMGDAGLSQEARRHRVRLLASANTPTAPSAAEPAPQRRRKQQTIGPSDTTAAPPPPDTSQDEILARQLAEQEGAVIEEGHLEKNEFGRFMCPAGCDKTFKFAGAAIKHGTKCVQDHRKRRRRGRPRSDRARRRGTAPRRRRRGRPRSGRASSVSSRRPGPRPDRRPRTTTGLLIWRPSSGRRRGGTRCTRIRTASCRRRGRRLLWYPSPGAGGASRRSAR